MNAPTQADAADKRPFAPDLKKLNASPSTREKLEKIADPIQRYKAASKIANDCYKHNPEIVKMRARRRYAFVLLHRDHGMNKALIARTVGAKDRRVVDGAFKGIDLRHVPKEWIVTDDTPDEERARIKEMILEEAKRLHKECVKREDMGTTAREVRRILIQELTMTTKHGQKYRPTDLAAMGGVTGPLISQNIWGSSNRTKAEQRARRRAKRGGKKDVAA